MAYSGKFRPKNPSKYKGNPTNIIFRSLWEYSLMNEFDLNSSILKWSSEEVVIPYESPIDGKYHRYFMDFWTKKKDGTETIIEVKPMSQSLPPNIKKKFTPKGRVSKRFITEAKTWAVNLAKWKAADKYAKKKGWKFIVLTEKGVSEHWKQFLQD